MDRLIECAELGFIRDIPVELVKLEKQNAGLIKELQLFKKKAINISIATGAVILATAIIIYFTNQKNKKNEKQIKLSY